MCAGRLSLALDAARVGRARGVGAPSPRRRRRVSTPTSRRWAPSAPGTRRARSRSGRAASPRRRQATRPGEHHPDPVCRAIACSSRSPPPTSRRAAAALRRPEGAAAGPSRELAHARVPDAPLRLVPRVGLRGRARQRDARARGARGKGIGRRRARGPALPDPAKRRRGDLEPQPALARSAGRIAARGSPR